MKTFIIALFVLIGVASTLSRGIHGPRNDFSNSLKRIVRQSGNGFVFPDDVDNDNTFSERPITERPIPQTPATPATPTTAPTGSTTTTMSPNMRTCIDSCPITAEYNPVCGTDNVTYSNPGRLRCAVGCGLNVQQKNVGQCSTSLIRG